MNDLTAAILCISIVGGLYYFWYKCRIYAVNRFTFSIGRLMWPVGALVGIYWAINDFFLFRKLNRSADINFKNKDTVTDKHSKISNELHLEAQEEYEKLVGIYCAIKDFFLFRKLNRNVDINLENKKNIVTDKHSKISNALYLAALEEYENGKKDKALYARLFAENDGKEELVKAKYIMHRVQQIIQS